jgi:hypothetical protein
MIFPPVREDVIQLPVKPMKRDTITEPTDRFRGKLRHYHRTSRKFKRTWDDWVEGDFATKRRKRNWLKVLSVTFSVLVLASIITGLVVELG